MKLTNKQKEEIDYLKTWTKTQVTDEDVEEYINTTVLGKEKGGKFSSNPLVQAQQRLGVTSSLWKEDLTTGLISIDELLDDATCDFERRLILSIRDSISPKYRRGKLTNNKATPLSISNFPQIDKLWKSALSRV